MALRFRCGTFLCCEDRLVGLRGRLRPCRLVAKKKWWAVGGTLPAGAISPRPRVGSTAAVCSVHVDPCDQKGKRGEVNAETHARSCESRGGGIHEEDDKEGGRAPVPPEKIDEWMHECIGEIVRKIGEAPLLVHVFFCNDAQMTGGPALKFETEAADPEKWRAIRSRWDGGMAAPPDGVILVEELQSEQQKVGGRRATATIITGPAAAAGGGDVACFGGGGGASSSTRTWGILVQGWGLDCAACYVLSTCRVPSTFGFCTHFCLTRARCFQETAAVQLKNSWLVGRPPAVAHPY